MPTPAATPTAPAPVEAPIVVTEPIAPPEGMMSFDAVDGDNSIPMDEALPPEASEEAVSEEIEVPQEGEPEAPEVPEEAPVLAEVLEAKIDQVTMTAAERDAYLAAKAERDNIAVMLDDPEFRVAYLKKIKADGLKRNPNFQLKPELEAMLTPAPVAQQGPTRAEVDAHIDALEAKGDFKEARRIEREFITIPEAEARAEARIQKRLDAERAAREANEQTRAQETARETQSKAYRAELAACHVAFPSIMNKSGQIIDAAVAAKLAEPEFIGTANAPGALAIAPYKRVISLALHEMGRLGTPQQVTRGTNAAAGRTPARGTTPPTPKAGVQTFEIVDRS